MLMSKDANPSVNLLNICHLFQQVNSDGLWKVHCKENKMTIGLSEEQCLNPHPPTPLKRKKKKKKKNKNK